MLSGPVLRDIARLSSDTPLLRAMGFLVSQHGQLGCDTPSPLSERFPFGEHAKRRCDAPQANGCDAPPSAILSRNGVAR